MISVTAVYYNGVRQTVTWTYPTASSVQMPSAPAAGVVVTADYTYAYQVRFSEDVIDLEEFMALLHACRTVKFQSARQPVAAWATATIVVLFANTTDFVVPGTIDLIEVYSGGAGGVGGGGGSWVGSGAGSHGGGGGGGYAYVRNPSVTVGDVLSITVGAGGKGLDDNDPFGADINKGGDTYVGPQPSWAGGAPERRRSSGARGRQGSGGYQFTPGGPGGHFPGYRRRQGGWYPGLDVDGGSGGGGAAGPNGRGRDGATNQASIRTPAAAAALATAARPASAPRRAAGAGGAGGTSPYGGGAGGAGGSSSADAAWPDYPSVDRSGRARGRLARPRSRPCRAADGAGRAAAAAADPTPATARPARAGAAAAAAAALASAETAACLTAPAARERAAATARPARSSSLTRSAANKRNSSMRNIRAFARSTAHALSSRSLSAFALARLARKPRAARRRPSKTRC